MGFDRSIVNRSANSTEVVYLKPENVVNEPKGQELAPLSAVELGSYTLDSPLRRDLSALAELIANITESYTAAIFIRQRSEDSLELGGAHTLSREFIYDAQIPFGRGLIGWAAEHGVRVSATPFEHDATTLLCYRTDQALKSFLAVPIIDENGKVAGVLACDSKKNYAFAKITEKILIDCAIQAASLLRLYRELDERSKIPVVDNDLLRTVFETLESHHDERELLTEAAHLPEELLEREALVVITTADGGVGEGTFYSTSHNRPCHHLLDMVCEHKKVLSAEKSIHARPTGDAKQRSFLSVPFQVLGKEAGSFNVLSKPFEAFDATQICSLEAVARVVGKHLELIRLRELAACSSEHVSGASWKRFAIQAKNRLDDARKKRIHFALIRLSFSNLSEIENLIGIESTSTMLQKVFRLVDQLKHPSGLSFPCYASQVLLLTPAVDVPRFTLRLRRLIERSPLVDLRDQLALSTAKLGELVLRGLTIVSAESPRDGETIEELTSKTVRLLELAVDRSATEGTLHVRNWG